MSTTVEKSVLEEVPAPNTIETRRVAIISNSHLTKRDAELLDYYSGEISKTFGVKPEGLYAVTEFGWQFNHDANLINWEQCGLSRESFETLSALLRHFDRVEFDRDAPALAEFPTFEW